MNNSNSDIIFGRGEYIHRIKKMQEYTPICIALAIATGLFRRFPKSWAGAGYLIVCIISAIWVFAPLVANSIEWASTYYSFLGMLNSKVNPAIEGAVYYVMVFSSMVTIYLIDYFTANTIPNFINRRFGDSSNETTEIEESEA